MKTKLQVLIAEVWSCILKIVWRELDKVTQYLRIKFELQQTETYAKIIVPYENA